MPGHQTPGNPGPRLHRAPAGPTPWRLEYNRIFRRQAASDPAIPWNTLNPSLKAANVLATASGTGTICPHCQATDHHGEDCALLSVDPFLDSQARTHRPPPPPPIRRGPRGPATHPTGLRAPAANHADGTTVAYVQTLLPPAGTGTYVATSSAWHQATQQPIALLTPRSRKPTGPPATKPN